MLLPNALFQQWKPGNAPRAIRPATARLRSVSSTGNSNTWQSLA
jgi:hypothetical protein